jgi:hypothetical protein
MLALSGADAGHRVVAVALTCLLGFERAPRGAPTGFAATVEPFGSPGMPSRWRSM